jgi:hypothetical protein
MDVAAVASADQKNLLREQTDGIAVLPRADAEAELGNRWRRRAHTPTLFETRDESKILIPGASHAQDQRISKHEEKPQSAETYNMGRATSKG